MVPESDDAPRANSAGKQREELEELTQNILELFWKEYIGYDILGNIRPVCDASAASSRFNKMQGL